MSEVTQALTMSIVFIVCSIAAAVALGGVGFMLVRRNRAGSADAEAGDGLEPRRSQGMLWLGIALLALGVMSLCGALVMGLSVGVFGWLSASP